MFGLMVSWCLASTAFAAPASCVCDCNGNRSVTVDEILTTVNVALGIVDASTCPSFLESGAPIIAVDVVVSCVDAALHGCHAATPTPTPTPDAGEIDLRFSSVSGDSLGYNCADDARDPKMQACLHNDGTGDAGPFSLVLGHSLRDVEIWRLASLPAGQNACIRVPLFDSAELRLDPDDEVAESHEDNNTSVRFLPTITRGPACTPTPTPGEPYPDCCEATDGCSERTHPADCFHSGGTGYYGAYTCDTESGACISTAAATPAPTATPAADPPDLVPDIVSPCSFALGCSAFANDDPYLIACVENLGPGSSPESELAIGSYWTVRVPLLAARQRECFRAPRIDHGRIVADPSGKIGESNESNNTLEFTTSDENAARRKAPL